MKTILFSACSKLASVSPYFALFLYDKGNAILNRLQKIVAETVIKQSQPDIEHVSSHKVNGGAGKFYSNSSNISSVVGRYCEYINTT